MSDDVYDEGSRVEAAAAGEHHEVAEAAHGVEPREHVTASPAIHHHHPADPNVGIVRAHLGRGAVLAATVSAAVTIAAVVLLALAIGGS